MISISVNAQITGIVVKRTSKDGLDFITSPTKIVIEPKKELGKRARDFNKCQRSTFLLQTRNIFCFQAT